MQFANESTLLLENRIRLELAERRATLLASLGPVPAVVRPRPFARRVTPLLRTVEYQHPVREVAPARRAA